jgi:ADP-ribosylglycohydrolase
MLGAIAGDVIGSVYEGREIKREDFPLFSPRCRFTDDTVLTVATAEAILSGADYGAKYREWYRAYPDRGFGGAFRAWGLSDAAGPYGSFGNGSAMRVSPVGWAFDGLDLVLAEARHSAAVTHDHPEGIKGAQATAAAVYLARTGASKDDLRAYLASTFGYDLNRTVEAIRPGYRFDVSCQGSVPEAVIAFLDSAGFEDAVRKAVSLGGDTDTQAAIAGSIAEAFYGGVPPEIERDVLRRLDARILAVLEAFRAKILCHATTQGRDVSSGNSKET